MFIPIQAETPAKHGQWTNWLIMLACIVVSIYGFNNAAFFVRLSGMRFRENPEEAEKVRELIREKEDRKRGPDKARSEDKGNKGALLRGLESLDRMSGKKPPPAEKPQPKPAETPQPAPDKTTDETTDETKDETKDDSAAGFFKNVLNKMKKEAEKQKSGGAGTDTGAEAPATAPAATQPASAPATRPVAVKTEKKIENPYLDKNPVDVYKMLRGEDVEDLDFSDWQNFGDILLSRMWLATLEPVLDTSQLPMALLAITSAFLHGGWFHLLGNMLFLWVFGNAVNGHLGQIKFLVLYLLCAIGSGMLHYAMSDNMVAVGASGAIYGVIGAYLVIFTYKRIMCVLLLIPFIRSYMIPGAMIIIAWVVWDLLMASFGSTFGGVALYGHLGGFATGFAITVLMVMAGLTKRDPESMSSSAFQ